MIRRPRLVALLASLTLVLGLSTGAATAVDANPLAADLDRILSDSRLVGATVGLVVKDAETGENIYTRSGNTRFQPGSTAKLITSATALDTLGPDHRWATQLRSPATVQGTQLVGDLYLRGTGDPTMLAADYDDLAAKLAATGVRTVTGSLVADDSWFDSVPLGTGWAWDDEPYYYSAQTSALTIAPDTDYDSGSIAVKVSPGAAAGQPAQVTLIPPVDLTIRNNATTSTNGGVFVHRGHGTNVVDVGGSLAPGAAPYFEYISVNDPTTLVAGLFRKSLAAHGITVTGGTEFRATPSSAPVLVEHQSMTLRQLLVPFLKLSNNLHAETLIKSMGRKVSGQGTWAAGISALEAALPGLDANPLTMNLFDGSGLSRMDLLSPDLFVSVLRKARTKPWFQDWYAALPIAGVQDRFVGGTLRNRMGGTAAANNVHAKTGSMTGVTALSGYVTNADGRKLVFSVMQNDFVSGPPRDIEDAIAVRLATDKAGQAQAQVQSKRQEPAPAKGDRKQDLECSWTKSC
ncbi:D-alanyl-D-alanine carboxypeptidase/D-alanyl-D-alanine-endopeptidase [Umezawaea endophytica]|uniref:D-alanyl-D-alanine carboxypeptidase/D-alanyl-D-alanine-endopeptidase n=1 Tax=Umezawaea endophytica TaxID=1654476 RepID=A0A9X2VLK8_9PSEU|nr:D-alanyl-D-alanine carboxypeptidase/D-alanyl-D-alanine-endopeptidase [Umezawaea endophytica]MCS7478252.1 D-alanyl-D-alanine carboxypeptidase/D-alanyl-D-alanine-endopeptidase [Umezawaea endophytica]